MKKLLIVLALICAARATSFSQDFQTGYFMKDYIYSYRLNPAFRPQKSFIGLPALSGISARSNGNVGIDNFLFPLDNGKLGTFMHPEVPASKFLGALSGRNKLSSGVTMNVLAFGFKTKGIYHTFDVSIRSLSGLSVPYELFSFMKEGIDGKIEIPTIKLHTTAFAEIAYGFSARIGSISAGIRLKGLVGAANARMEVKNLSVESDGGRWTVSADGTLKGAAKGLAVPVKSGDDGEPVIDLEGITDELSDIDKPAGAGGAIDLGVSWKIQPKLELSASITDLGAIRWKNNINGRTANATWTYDGDSDDVLDDLSSLLEFRPEDEAAETMMLPVTARLGARYELLSFLDAGLLLTHGFGAVPWNEARVSANARLLGFLGLTGAAAAGTFGFSWGLAANFNLKVLSLFVGADSIPTRYTPQYIPLGKPNLAFTFGINITI